MPALDGLRGVAIAAVLIHHFATPLLDGPPGSASAFANAALRLSYTGVDLFFVLSGYLIGGVLLDHRESPSLLGTFYLRRTARIMPLAFLCIGVTLAAQAAGWFGPPAGGEPWPVAVYAAFVPNLWMAATLDWGYRPLSVLWSLGIEEQFYLVAPWLILLVPRPTLPRFLLGLVIVAPVFRLGLISLNPDWAFAASLLPFGRTDCLGAGLLLAWMVREPAARDWGERQRAWLLALLALAAAGMVALTWLGASNAGRVMALGGYTVAAVFYALVLWFTVVPLRPGWTHWLVFRPLVQLGRWSYFIYLFHGLGVGLAVGLLFHGRFAVISPSNVWQLLAGLTGVFAAAALSMRFIEAPFLRWAHRRGY